MFVKHTVTIDQKSKKNLALTNVGALCCYTQRWAATLNYATQPLSVSIAAPEFHIFCVALARS
jgi:hypothetical protein